MKGMGEKKVMTSISDIQIVLALVIALATSILAARLAVALYR
jgi:photosystem I reaction center subunit XII